MGLGLNLLAAVPRGGLRRQPGREAIFESITKTVNEFARRQPAPLSDWTWAATQGDVLHVSLFPVEEDIEFSVDSQRVTCSAKTSTAGPGYHAHVIALLDELQSVNGLEWDETIADSQDETGFRASRDFGRLQDAMAEWLHGLARHVVSEMGDYGQPLLLGMPLGFAPKIDAFAASPMGPWSQEWLTDVASAGRGRLREMAAQYFCWWEQGITGRNLLGFALARCWMDVPWVVPQEPSIRRMCESVLAAFEHAKALDAGLELPVEAAELKALLAADAELKAPHGEGIGYLRRTMNRSLPGSWTIELPGYFSSALEDDGGTQVYFFAGRTVRGSSFSFKLREGATAEDLLRERTQHEGELRLELEPSHLAGKYTRVWKE